MLMQMMLQKVDQVLNCSLAVSATLAAKNGMTRVTALCVVQ